VEGEGPAGEDVEGRKEFAEARSRGMDKDGLSSSSLSSSMVSRALASTNNSSSACGSQAGGLTQVGEVDSSSAFASMVSLALQSLQRSPGGAWPKASSMRMSVRPAVKQTTAWSITPLIQIGVQARACSWWRKL
jgi:hypothetical protein